ncbi:SMP-30/gluconolactonase/LRE family protein [Stygiolobus caldivivus]|uniref:SMP-30/gluconolactonase/LRE family protein n=1 Tax=Stygiolobus caldivivus TaxID=2824673 RepID=UPI001C849856|nr:SMP-30/gluconolactonase/LRE family protein [Stygiolobus caldivivus]
MKKVVDNKGRLYEGPVWYRDTLYFVDILRGEIHSLRHGKHEIMKKIGSYVSSLQPYKKGGLIVTSGRGFYHVIGDDIRLIYEVRDWDSRNRFNDGKCDAMGRYWVGTMNLEEKYPTGALFVLDKHLQLRKVLEGVTISNGLGWNIDNTKMYYIDSPTKKVFEFAFNLTSGEIRDRKVLVDLTRYDGVPDGMTVDSEGYLWVALYGGGRVLRISPKGEIVGEIRVPASHTTSVTFGGPDLKTLFITTANDEPDGGYVYAVESDVKGTETFECDV